MKVPANQMPPASAYRPGSRDAGIRRYFSLGVFAAISGVPYSQLHDWRRSAQVWVPSPDIQIGVHPGWSLPCIQAFDPDGNPFLRPRTVEFASQTAVKERYHGMPTSTLWVCIGDGSIPGPVVWVDDWPGWLL